jgi:hypothetical protein
VPGVDDQDPLEDEGGEVGAPGLERGDAEQIVVLGAPRVAELVRREKLPGRLRVALREQRFGASEIGSGLLSERARRPGEQAAE